MNRKFFLCFVSILVCLTAGARGVRLWTAAELLKISDLVVVAWPVAVKDLQETNSLGWTSTPAFQTRFRGVETTFKVLKVIKGAPENDRVVLHHYRYQLEWGSPPNGPMLITFKPEATNDYVLYLAKETAGRYAPAAGQMDAALSVAAAGAITNFASGIPMFPILPALADANPSIRYPVSIRVPTRLKIQRTDDTLSVTVDTNGFEATTIMVGTNMIIGSRSQTFIYPEGGQRAGDGDLELKSGLAFGAGERYWHTASDHIPVPGKKYVVEREFEVFETDIPPQHDWNPAGKNFKILRQRTLKQIVE